MSLLDKIMDYKQATPARQEAIISELHSKKRFAQLCALYDYSVMQSDGTLDPRPFEELAQRDPEFRSYWDRFVRFKEASREEQGRVLGMLAASKKYQEIIDLHEAGTAVSSSLADFAQMQLLAMEDREFGNFYRAYQDAEQKIFDLTFLHTHLDIIVETAFAIQSGEIDSAEDQWSRVYSICKKMYSLTRDLNYPFLQKLEAYVKKALQVDELPEAVLSVLRIGVEEFHGADFEDEYFEGYADDDLKQRFGRKALDDFFGV